MNGAMDGDWVDTPGTSEIRREVLEQGPDRQRAPAGWCGGLSSINGASESRCNHDGPAPRSLQGQQHDRHRSSLEAMAVHEGDFMVTRGQKEAHVVSRFAGEAHSPPAQARFQPAAWVPSNVLAAAIQFNRSLVVRIAGCARRSPVISSIKVVDCRGWGGLEATSRTICSGLSVDPVQDCVRIKSIGVRRVAALKAPQP